MKTLTLDGKALQAVAGHFDETLRLIEDRFHVRVSARGDEITLVGTGEGEERVAELFRQLAGLHSRGVTLGSEELKTAVELMHREREVALTDHFVDARIATSTRKAIVPRSRNQRLYLEAMRQSDLVLGIGPAGTGKTYLAVAMAVSYLNEKKVKRIILARPAVEAGERLGFLPGDIAAKVDPYLRPLYDALYDMMEPNRAERMLERGTIEVAPLAFMRGRTLNSSFVILDEAQNSTSEQMKMFLTRIGYESKAVVTGDITQIDLPAGKTSGLVEARAVVDGIPGISFVLFDDKDVVRHPLVQRIILAYDRHDAQRRDASGRSGQGNHHGGDVSGPTGPAGERS